MIWMYILSIMKHHDDKSKTEHLTDWQRQKYLHLTVIYTNHLQPLIYSDVYFTLIHILHLSILLLKYSTNCVVQKFNIYHFIR